MSARTFTNGFMLKSTYKHICQHAWEMCRVGEIDQTTQVRVARPVRNGFELYIEEIEDTNPCGGSIKYKMYVPGLMESPKLEFSHSSTKRLEDYVDFFEQMVVELVSEESKQDYFRKKKDDDNDNNTSK